jgi:hypothetical protein
MRKQPAESSSEDELCGSSDNKAKQILMYLHAAIKKKNKMLSLNSIFFCSKKSGFP